MTSDYIRNFPFETLRAQQESVLKEMDEAYASYDHIILAAPTGFGKSPVGIAAALTLGSSYICTSTKNLQTQYVKDFSYVKEARGKSNFKCEKIIDGLIRAKIITPSNGNNGNVVAATTTANVTAAADVTGAAITNLYVTAVHVLTTTTSFASLNQSSRTTGPWEKVGTKKSCLKRVLSIAVIQNGY